MEQEEFHLIPTEKLREIDFTFCASEITVFSLFKPLVDFGKGKIIKPSRLQELTPDQQLVMINAHPSLGQYLPAKDRVERPSSTENKEPLTPSASLPDLDRLNLLDRDIYEYPDRELLNHWDPSKRKEILQGEIAKEMVASAKKKIANAETEGEKKAILKDLFSLQALKDRGSGAILLISNFEKEVLIRKADEFRALFTGYFIEGSENAVIEIADLNYLDQFLTHWETPSQLPQDDEFNQLEFADRWHFTHISQEVKARLKKKIEKAFEEGNFEVAKDILDFCEEMGSYSCLDIKDELKKDLVKNVKERLQKGEFQFIEALENGDLIKELPGLEIDFSKSLLLKLSPDSLPFLKKLPIVKLTLSSSHIKLFKGTPWLENFKQIERLEIRGSEWTDEDLMPLKQCKQLKALKLFSCKELKGTFCHIRDLKNLKELEVHHCPLIQESFFSGLKELKLSDVDLEGVEHLPNDLIEDLKDMPLSRLRLRDCQPPLEESSLKIIQRLAPLHTLILTGSFKFTEETLKYIDHPDLRTLGLSYSTSLAEALTDHLKTHLPKLENLYFGSEYFAAQLEMIRKGEKDL